MEFSLLRVRISEIRRPSGALAHTHTHTLVMDCTLGFRVNHLYVRMPVADMKHMCGDFVSLSATPVQSHGDPSNTCTQITSSLSDRA